MSLQVWLPLNGDLHNQGLSNITVTNNSATVDNNGKIGKCYSFNGSNNYLYTPYNFYNNRYSVCAWIYTTSSSATQTIICDRTTVGSGFSIFLIGGGIRIDCGGNSLQWYTAYTYPINTWFHLTVTYDGNIVYYYINGEFKEKKTQTLASNQWGTTTSIGASQTNGSGYGNYLNGKLNDVRIYDHALSAKEVEEIAKGLVLHYKLDDPFCEPTTNLLTETQSCPTYTNINLGKNVGSLSPATCTCGNAIITYSAYIKNTSNVTVRIRCSPLLVAGSYGTFQGNIINPGEEGWSSVTCDLTDSTKYTGSIYLYFQNGSSGAVPSSPTFQVYHAQVEQKSYRTPWVLGGTSRSSSTVYDSSGYSNNGTIVGSLETVVPSSRYGCATHFTATTSKVLIENLNTSGFANSYSFIWWGKTNTFSNKMFWGFANGVRLNGIYNGNLWNTGDGANNPLYTPGTTTQVTAPSLNSWHHFAMVGNGTTCVVYLDGELWGQAKTYKSISGTKIYMNGWDSGTSYTTNDMSISDFRIYATALTPEQIKELYNTSMSIDNNGNIHVRELVE